MIQLNPKESQRVYELKQEGKTTPDRANSLCEGPVAGGGGLAGCRGKGSGVRGGSRAAGACRTW